MQGKKRWIPIPFVLIIILIIIVKQFSFYPTEIEAYNAENSDDNIISQKIATVQIDNIEYFLGKTENEEYILTPFEVRNNKFKSKSHYDLYDELVETGNDSSIINFKRYYYRIIQEEHFSERNLEKSTYSEFEYGGVDYIFQIAEREVNDTDFNWK